MEAVDMLSHSTVALVEVLKRGRVHFLLSVASTDSGRGLED